MTPKDVLKMAKEKGVRIVDLRFIDLLNDLKKKWEERR